LPSRKTVEVPPFPADESLAAYPYNPITRRSFAQVHTMIR
jgi:hypothetical protein